MSGLEEILNFQMRAHKVRPPEREYKFARDIVGHGKGIRERLKLMGLKDWRFDFAWPDMKFAVEVEGGGWTGGRHTTGAGFRGDMEKYHHALQYGWLVYRCDAELINNGKAILLIAKLMKRADGGGDECRDTGAGGGKG